MATERTAPLMKALDQAQRRFESALKLLMSVQERRESLPAGLGDVGAELGTGVAKDASGPDAVKPHKSKVGDEILPFAPSQKSEAS